MNKNSIIDTIFVDFDKNVSIILVRKRSLIRVERRNMLSILDKAKGIAALKSLSVLLNDKTVKPYICWDNDKNFVKTLKTLPMKQSV